MPTDTRHRADRTTEAKENLQTRYKPIGLRAVVAATQCKTETKKDDENRVRDIPAVLQSHED